MPRSLSVSIPRSPLARSRNASCRTSWSLKSSPPRADNSASAATTSWSSRVRSPFTSVS